MPTPVIFAAFILATAFCVAGLLVQREHDMQRRISAQVERNHAARSVHALHTAHTAHTTQTAQTPITVPLAGVLDGGAPLPAIVPVALVSQPDDAPRFSDFAEDTDTPSIPDEVVIGDIAEQPTQIIPAAEMSAIAAATAARDHVPPKILEALGARWLLAYQLAPTDHSLN